MPKKLTKRQLRKCEILLNKMQKVSEYFYNFVGDEIEDWRFDHTYDNFMSAIDKLEEVINDNN